MHFGILIVFCGTIVLVKTYPALVFDYYNQNTGDVEDIELRDNYPSSDYKQSPCLRSHNGGVKCLFYNEVPDIPETSEYSLQPIELSESQLKQDQASIYERNGNFENSAPTENLPFNPNYNVYNHESPIRTYIHGLVPQDTVFYGDVYPSEDSSPFNRLVRRTTSYDEFLAQLSHDAQMNNILPTMPFLRTSGSQYYVPYGSGPVSVQASFPRAVGGCARPLIFGCSPIIYQGVLVHKGYSYAPAVQVSNPIYKEAQRNHKVIRNKIKPHVDSNKKEHLEVSKVSGTDGFIAN